MIKDTRKPYQMPPHGHWRHWVVIGGRGAGKTFAAVNWIADVARTTPDAWLAYVAPDIMRARRALTDEIPHDYERRFDMRFRLDNMATIVPFGEERLHSVDKDGTRLCTFGFLSKAAGMNLSAIVIDDAEMAFPNTLAELAQSVLAPGGKMVSTTTSAAYAKHMLGKPGVVVTALSPHPVPDVIGWMKP